MRVRNHYTILLVDDEPKIVQLVQAYLEKDGYRILVATDGLQALDLARSKQPDLIILDLLLPSLDGLDVCRILRSESRVPIIMLTAKTTEDDRLIGLDLGADDYVTKPFSPRELIARVRAVLRRSEGKTSGGQPDVQRIGGLVIDRNGHEVRINDEPVPLTPTEFQLLATLADQVGRTFTRPELLDRVFGYDFEGFERNVDVHIKNLRKKIEPDPKQPTIIQTVYGVGYKLTGD